MRLVFGLALALAACGGHNKASIALYEKGDYAGASRAADEGLQSHPEDEGLWQMKIRAALAQGDANALAKAYESYAKTRDDLDKSLLRDLSVATLGQALSSPSTKLKIAAIDVVEQVEIHDLADQVAQQMEDDNDRVAATAAAAVLNGFPDAPKVIDQMLRSDDAEARAIAIDVLGNKGYKRVGSSVFVELEKGADDPDARVRRVALRWLGQRKDPEAYDLCVKRMKDPDDGVRAAAATALARIGNGNLADHAKRALADRMIAVRLAGIDLLVAAHDRAGLKKLLDDAEPLVALMASIELHEGGAAALDKAIKSDTWTTRSAAMNYAARAVDRETVKKIANTLASDPEVGVRVAAARALAHAGDKAAAIAILAAAYTTDTNAAADLAELGDTRGNDALSEALRDGKRPADERARIAFAHRTAHRVTSGLVAALADANGIVRVEAAATLAVLSK